MMPPPKVTPKEADKPVINGRVKREVRVSQAREGWASEHKQILKGSYSLPNFAEKGKRKPPPSLNPL